MNGIRNRLACTVVEPKDWFGMDNEKRWREYCLNCTLECLARRGPCDPAIRSVPRNRSLYDIEYTINITVAAVQRLIEANLIDFSVTGCPNAGHCWNCEMIILLQNNQAGRALISWIHKERWEGLEFQFISTRILTDVRYRLDVQKAKARGRTIWQCGCELR